MIFICMKGSLFASEVLGKSSYAEITPFQGLALFRENPQGFALRYYYRSFGALKRNV